MKAVFSLAPRISLIAFLLTAVCLGQDPPAATSTPKPANREQAEAVINKAIQNLGGEKYLGVKTQVGRGKYSTIQDGGVISFQTFIDVIVFPSRGGPHGMSGPIDRTDARMR